MSSATFVSCLRSSDDRIYPLCQNDSHPKEPFVCEKELAADTYRLLNCRSEHGVTNALSIKSHYFLK
jgi:hypothetical protein